MSSLTSTLDLNKLLLLSATLSLLVSISVAPFYNFPLSLYGLYVNDVGASRGEFGSDSLRAFTGMLGLSAILDVFWLISWSGLPSSFATFLIIVNLALKPIILLACTANLRQRGEATLPSFGQGNTVWSMPGGFSSNANGYSGVGGDGDADADEFSVPTSPPKSRAAPPPSSSAPRDTPQKTPRGPAQGGGYHTLGEDE